MNTIGTVRVACSNGAALEGPAARMTSGASATNSAASLRIASASAAAQRMSIRTLRPMIQPDCSSACWNAPMRACQLDRSQPRARARRCAASAPAAARAHERPRAAAPPSSVMNSRRFNAIKCLPVPRYTQSRTSRTISSWRELVSRSLGAISQPASSMMSPVGVRLGRRGMSALSPFYPHVWTAPSWQGLSSPMQIGRCAHVFGLLRGSHDRWP